MLQPARRKYRKEQKGRNTGVATRGATVAVGAVGSFVASPAPFLFYRVQARDDVGSVPGVATVNGGAKGS